MLYHRALSLTLLLLSGSAAAFNIAPSGRKKEGMPSTANKNLANALAAGVISAATLLPLPGPAVAADSLVLGTPLETRLANFGAASYPVFNSITDVSPLFDRFLDLIDNKKMVKGPDAADVAQKAVDGLLAIPDSAITRYSDVLKQDVYSGVSKGNCVTLGGSGSAAKKLAASAPVKSVDPSKIEALKNKFQPANSAVPMRGGNICLPGSVAASEKLWVGQAELTFSMPKKEAGALVSSIEKAGFQANRPSLALMVPAAEGVFSKSPEALKMVTAGKNVEPSVISTVRSALKNGEGQTGSLPLETKLANFGAASYPVFNSITDVSPLADKFLDQLENKEMVKAPDAADVAQKAVDGLLAIPKSAITKYSDVLRREVYSDVSKENCVTLGGSGAAAQKIAAAAAVKSVDPSKITELKNKFQPANSAVPIKDGNICLPGSAAASEKLWVAQAELTFSMPKKEAGALVSSIKKAGTQASRGRLASLVPAAEEVFSKSPEARKMVTAGKNVEPSVISTVQAALE